MLSGTNISVSKLAKYSLDFAKLVQKAGSIYNRYRVDIDHDLFDSHDLIYVGDTISVHLPISYKINREFDTNEELEQFKKEQEQICEANKILFRSIQRIVEKSEVDSFTKSLVLQTGILTFDVPLNSESKRKGRQEIPLFQVPVKIDFDLNKKDYISITIKPLDDYIAITNFAFSDFLSQSTYDQLFREISEFIIEKKNYQPLVKDNVNELIAIFTNCLSLDKIKVNSIDFELKKFFLNLVQKVNYFLTEDLKSLVDIPDEKFKGCSLSAWEYDEDMNYCDHIDDKGLQPLYFPFPYDKYQLQVVGLLRNKSAVVEGPPGTGKSQTIANLLIHLAATGHKVLFASQKDQAVRGVKEKLATLGIDLLFGYIPDKTSKLYSDKDEKDSASNTLKKLSNNLEEYRLSVSEKKISSDLDLIAGSCENYTNQIRLNEHYYDINEELLKLDTYKNYLGFTSDIVKKLKDILVRIDDVENQLQNLIGVIDEEVEKFWDERLKIVNFRYRPIYKWSENLKSIFDKNYLERGNSIKKFFTNSAIRHALNLDSELVPQEIYSKFSAIINSDDSKAYKLNELSKNVLYYKHGYLLEEKTKLKKDLQEICDSLGLDKSQMKSALDILDEVGVTEFLNNIAKYKNLEKELAEVKEPSNLNKLREEIKEQRKTYNIDIKTYLLNTFDRKTSDVLASKENSAIIKRAASSLKKSRKAYKTFDVFKNGELADKNFSVITGLMPIWLMSLEDVSRIIPNEMGCFDYVLIDEASQCNLAYSLPAMYRGKHTIFFGDTLQMRDQATLFKSNAQLDEIARKNDISEFYQIKSSDGSLKSVMDIAELSGFKTVSLKCHYRSPSALIGFSNANFYEKEGRRLEVLNDQVLTYKETGRVLLNHVIKVNPFYETNPTINVSEANYISNLISEIKNDPALKHKSIAVLTFFNEQAEYLRKIIKDKDIKISIIEGIQGDERDIVIYSFVIKSPDEKNRYVALTGEGGDLRKEINAGRVNVAFSRARQQVHCVTSLPIDLWPDGIWIKKYLQYVEENGLISERFKRDALKFDSHFEEDVFTFLYGSLSTDYWYTTQYPCCGYRIDLVIRNNVNGRRLAIECDGPHHFDDGLGNVYSERDWYRQYILEKAGFEFYRVSYFDWIRNKEEEKTRLLEFINNYFSDEESEEIQSDKFNLMQSSGIKSNEYQDNSSMQIDDEGTEFKLDDKFESSDSYSDRERDGLSKKNLKKSLSSNESETSLKEKRKRSSNDSKSSNKKTKVNTTIAKDAEFVDRKVTDQEVTKFLENHLGVRIRIFYLKKGAKKPIWYTLVPDSYDNKYLYIKSSSANYSIKYLISNICEFEESF